MKRAGAILLVVLLSACGRSSGPRATRLHTAPFQYLNAIRVGMRERELTHERALRRIGPGEYSETVASYGVIYVTANQRLIGLIVPEMYPNETGADIAFVQHQQEAFRSLGITPVCAFDARENRRIALYRLPDGVHEIALRMASPNATVEITRSLLLAPSVQWRRARPQPCNG